MDPFTVLFCTSAMGDKLKPTLISKSKLLKILKGANMDTIKVRYRHQSKAWMVAHLFQELLLWFDQEVGRGIPQRLL